MTLSKNLCFLLLASGLVFGQAPANDNNGSSGTPSVADELKALREKIARNQQQITRQQQQLDDLNKKLNNKGGAAISPRLVDASLSTSSSTATAAARTAAEMQTQPQQPEAQGAKSPLSFKIGAADFTPGGFVDFENIFRTTNTGNVAATNFGAIPYSNTVQGHLTEYRSTGQYSRFNIKTTTKFGKNDVTGYVEFDFNGNDAGNVFVTSNGHTDRLRLYWLDLKRGKWEFLGGRRWVLQKTNRVGVSPNPADLSLGYQEDAGIGVGYNYTRAGEFRAAYHFNDHWVWAAAIQNPQQFTGGEVTFPFVFSAQLGAQTDTGAVPGTPNVAPDVLTKLAFDHDFAGGRHFHWEAGGIETAKKITILPTAVGSTFTSHSTVGGGVFGDVLVDLWKGSEGRSIRFVASDMYGYGIGRYLNGLAPDVIVRPVSTGATTFDAVTSGIHAGDVVGGVEIAPHSKTQLGAYYGGMYAQRNFFVDITSPLVVKPFQGFGFPNSGTNQNRTVQEGTVDWTQTFWRNPQYGAVLLVTQGSYITRAPWFVAAGAPKNAHLFMGYVSLRYVLP